MPRESGIPPLPRMQTACDPRWRSISIIPLRADLFPMGRRSLFRAYSTQADDDDDDRRMRSLDPFPTPSRADGPVCLPHSSWFRALRGECPPDLPPVGGIYCLNFTVKSGFPGGREIASSSNEVCKNVEQYSASSSTSSTTLDSQAAIRWSWRPPAATTTAEPTPSSRATVSLRMDLSS